MKPRHRRAALVVAGVLLVGGATALVLKAFRSNVVFFYTPSEIAAGEAGVGRSLRIGGLVEQGSLHREADGVSVRFVVTDRVKRVPVTYQGLLPDLFREGRGVVAEGRLEADGHFAASQVLAKHDENYMPPEAANALEQAAKAQNMSRKTLIEHATQGKP